MDPAPWTVNVGSWAGAGLAQGCGSQVPSKNLCIIGYIYSSIKNDILVGICTEKV